MRDKCSERREKKAKKSDIASSVHQAMLGEACYRLFLLAGAAVITPSVTDEVCRPKGQSSYQRGCGSKVFTRFRPNTATRVIDRCFGKTPRQKRYYHDTHHEYGFKLLFVTAFFL